MIVFKYIVFAIVSTAFNLAFQYLSFELYVDYGALYIAMFIGTIAGLVVKYFLDKKFIFCYKVKNKKDDAKKFVLYSLMGVVTTIIFWGTEVVFDMLSQDPKAKYIGAIIGLSFGYIIKYFLDKTYVFNK